MARNDDCKPQFSLLVAAWVDMRVALGIDALRIS